MTKFPNRWIRRSLSLLVLLPLQACAIPLNYSAKPIQGYVVDANTRAPIAGAVIVADWEVKVAGGGDRVRSLQTIETVTDKDGRYAIPGWGPKLRPTGTELTDSDPALIVFKSSYVPEFLYNERERTTSVRISDWDGKTIQLKPFRGTPKARVDSLEHLVDSVHHGPPLNALYGELQRERETLGQLGRRLFVEAEDLREERP